MNNGLIDIIDNAIKVGFTGYIQINMFKGGVSNINKFESIKLQPEKLESDNALLSKEVQE